MRLLLLSCSLFLAACAGSVPVTTTITRTDTVITVKARVVHDTTSLSPIYYGGQNAGCDTAAILAAANFTIRKVNSAGGISEFQYDALKRRFEALSSIPPQKIVVPGLKTTKLEVQRLGLWDYVKIGSVAIVLFIGLIVVGKGLLPLITKLPLPI